MKFLACPVILNYFGATWAGGETSCAGWAVPYASFSGWRDEARCGVGAGSSRFGFIKH